MTNKKDSTVKAVSYMMIITLLGKILGLVRDQFLASNYGYQMEASAFLVASRIPRIFFDVVFASAISASFIPIFNEYMKNKGKDEAFKLSNNFITIIGILTTLITVLGMTFAPQLTNLFAVGFNEETMALSVNLLRLLFPATIFTGFAFSFVGILQSMDEFNIPAAMSIASNAIIIIYYIFFNKFFGIYGLTIAFLIGWAMQAIMQLPSLFKRKYFYKPHLDLKDEGLKKILTLMIPVMVSTWIQPINLSISTRFASKFLDGGGVTIIEYANTLYSIIVGIFVLSIANVIFPRLSRIVIDKDTNKFNETITTILEIMSFLLIPMAVGVMCLSVPIVRLIFERGHFDSSGTAMTANALLFFALGMLGFGVQTILSRAYYAEKNGKIPLLSGLISVISNGILCFIMSPIWGISGLALASTISTFIAALVLVIPMHKKSGIISKKFITENFKMFLCAIVMAVGVIFTLTFLEGKFEYNLIGNILYAALPCAVGVLIYILMSIILKVSQAQTILELAKKILKGRKTV